MSQAPTVPVRWTDRDAQNLKLLYQNKLPPENGQQLFEFIIKNLCGVNEMSIRFGEPDATAFNEGRRFVGMKIVNMATVPLAQLHEAEKQVALVRAANAKRSMTVRRKPNE